jgi:hypothetical protein
MDTPQDGDNFAHGPTTHSPGLDHPSEFSLLATSNAYRSSVSILAHVVYYVIPHREKVSLADFADFMRRARWKAYHTERRLAKFGNYLETI